MKKVFLSIAFILMLSAFAFAGWDGTGGFTDGASTIATAKSVEIGGSATIGATNTTEGTTEWVQFLLQDSEGNTAEGGVAIGGHFEDETATTEDMVILFSQKIDGAMYTGGKYVFYKSFTDGAKLLFPGGYEGQGIVSCPATGAYISFTYTSAGVVTAYDTGANQSTTEDNDTTLNVYDAGAGIGINSELGDTYNILVDITCVKSGAF